MIIANAAMRLTRHPLPATSDQPDGGHRPPATGYPPTPVIPLQQFLPAALADVLRRAPLTPEKVAFAWRHAVGAAVDRVTVVELVDDRLVVRVNSVQWKRELDRSTSLISSRLGALLGPGTVQRIEVVGPAPAARTHRRSRKF